MVDIHFLFFIWIFVRHSNVRMFVILYLLFGCGWSTLGVGEVSFLLGMTVNSSFQNFNYFRELFFHHGKNSRTKT